MDHKRFTEIVERYVNQVALNRMLHLFSLIKNQ